MKYEIEIVSDRPDLWKDGDPVRPELGVSYKTYPGRQVYGLKDESGEHVAFSPEEIIPPLKVTDEKLAELNVRLKKIIK